MRWWHQVVTRENKITDLNYSKCLRYTPAPKYQARVVEVAATRDHIKIRMPVLHRNLPAEYMLITHTGTRHVKQEVATLSQVGMVRGGMLGVEGMTV